MEGRKNGDLKKRRLRSFYRHIKALSPTKYLVKARDFYVRNMKKFAKKCSSNGLAAVPSIHLMTSQPNTFGTRDQEFQNILKAMSRKSKNFKFADAEDPFSRNLYRRMNMERLDEDRPVYFGGSFRMSEKEDTLRPLRSC
ncbi:hypothetical protein SUGI_0559500 [Cryptomeria japonica]|nr:hypothetical protein SUGI_0559500 [Cryptomeria japonica]